MNHAYDLGHSAIIYASQRKYDLLAEKAELLVEWRNLKQQRRDAEAELAAKIEEGIGDAEKQKMVDGLEALQKQLDSVEADLLDVITVLVKEGFGAKTELADGDVAASRRFTSLLTGQTVTIKGRSLEFAGEVLTDVRVIR
jgi:hypothetical protein